jgi:pimeloyl-ACP methyl ester carboxylesterase
MISLSSVSHEILLGTFALSIYSFCEPTKLVASGDGKSDGSASADTIDPKLAVGSHQAKLADVSLHYVVAGHGHLVFVTSPGWGIGSLYLQRGLAPLEKTFTVVYLDTRGSGGSSRPGRHKADEYGRSAGSRLGLYANVGHFPYIEEPTRFFSEVSQFLAD